MASFLENISTINTATYGKEMRPAISEALSQSWDLMNRIEETVNDLNTRADNLSGGGGTDVDGSIIINDALSPSTLVVYGGTTAMISVGSASLVRT